MNDLAVVYDALGQQWALAERLAKTNFVPAPMRGKPEEVLAAILTGQELGIGPMQALRHIHVIQGRPTLSAELMASRVRAAGHRIRTIESTAQVATVEGARADDPDAPEKVTWTIDDARRANLLGKDNWKQYPAAMLWARAVSALCRRLFGDVLGGVSYTPDEIPAVAASTEVAWGEVEVDRATGEVLEDSPTGPAVTTTPAGPVATTPSVPTLEQIQAITYKPEVYKLIGNATANFREHVKAAVRELHHREARDFQDDASVEEWKHVLEYAVELHDHQTHETTQMSAAGRFPPPAADPNFETSGAGRAGQAEFVEMDKSSGEGSADPAMTPAPDSPGQPTLHGGDT